MNGSEEASYAAKRTNMMARHPNASIALGSGSGVGALVVWLIGLSGAQMPAEVGAVVAGMVASIVLFVGRRGIKPSLIALWSGRGPDAASVPARLEGSPWG